MFKPLAMTLLVTLAPLAVAADNTTDFAFEPAISQLAPAEMPLLDIDRAGERLVAVGERGLVVVSDDDGASWRQVDMPVSTTFTALDFADARSGWAVGHAGIIVYTADGGDNWQVQFDGNEANRQYLEHATRELASMRETLNQLQASELDQQAIDDFQYRLEDAEFAVQDAGQALQEGPVNPFLDVLMLNNREGFALGAYGMLYRTADGGDNWELAISGIDNPDRYHYYAMAADKQGNLYMSGEAGLLYVSQDVGANWRRVEGVYEGSLFGILTQGDTVLTFGLRGNIFRSTDAGERWSAVDSGRQYSLYGGDVLADGRIVLVGAAGQVLVSRDGGENFRAWSHPARQTLSGAIAASGDDFYIVGLGGVQAQRDLEAADD